MFEEGNWGSNSNVNSETSCVFFVVVVVCFYAILQKKDLSKNANCRHFCAYKELSATSVGKWNF